MVRAALCFSFYIVLSVLFSTNVLANNSITLQYNGRDIKLEKTVEDMWALGQHIPFVSERNINGDAWIFARRKDGKWFAYKRHDWAQKYVVVSGDVPTSD